MIWSRPGPGTNEERKEEKEKRENRYAG